jgi:hypothetical protein
MDKSETAHNAHHSISPAIVAAEKKIAILLATSRLLYQRER